MINIYLNYVSSLETGDVDVSEKVYTSFSRAVEGLDHMIQEYVGSRNAEKSYVVYSKEDFNLKKINKSSSVPTGTYLFRKKKSSVGIYKKVVEEGRLWNGSRIEKIGKMGILSEINIPVDKKLMRLIKLIQTEQEQVVIPEAPPAPSFPLNLTRSVKSGKDFPSDFDVTVSSDDLDQSDDYTTSNTSKPSNYEHGKHVSFVSELKARFKKRKDRTDVERFIKNKTVEPNTPTTEHQQFINSLNSAKKTLNKTPDPVIKTFGLGRVLSDSSLKKSKAVVETIRRVETIKTEVSSELSYHSSSENSAPQISVPVISVPQITRTKSCRADEIINEIMEIVKVNENRANRALEEYERNTAKLMEKDYYLEERSDNYSDDDYLSSDESTEEVSVEWEVIEYYEGESNSVPLPRKYIGKIEPSSLTASI